MSSRAPDHLGEGATVTFVEREVLQVPLQFPSAARLANGTAWPNTKAKLVAFALDLAERIAVLAPLVGLAPGLPPKQGATLQAPARCPTPLGDRAEIGLVHMAEQVQRKPLRWGLDLVGEVLLGPRVKPVDGVMGQEQADVVTIDPFGTMLVTGTVELSDVQVESLLKVAAP